MIVGRQSTKSAKYLVPVVALVRAIALAASTLAALPDRQESESKSAPFGSAAANEFRYDSNGTLRYSFEVGSGEAVDEVVVRSRNGGPSDAAKTIEVFVDDTSRGEKVIGANTDGKTYRERAWAVNLGPGRHTVGVNVRGLGTAGVGEGAFTDWVELRGTGAPPARPGR